MRRLANTWALAKSSWALLRHDRELIWLPVLGMVTALVAVLAFAGPVFALTRANTSGDANPALGWILAGAGYLTVASVVIFFQAAVVAGAHQRIEGGDPTVSSAIEGARRHLRSILAWAVIASTVSMVIDAIEERFGLAGAILGTVLDVAWRVTTFLVLPVIVVEETGAVEGVKRSARMLRESFGERIIADVGFGLLGFVLAIPALAFAGLAVGAGIDAVTFVAIAVAVVYMLGVSAVISALSGVFQVVLHRQVTGRPLPPEFDPGQVAGVIRSR